MLDILRCCDGTLMSVITRISLLIHEVCGLISRWSGEQGGGGRDGETRQDGLPRASHLGTETPDKVNRNAINAHLRPMSLVTLRPQWEPRTQLGQRMSQGMSSQASPKKNQNLLLSNGWGKTSTLFVKR